jgi:hypothetical protein
MSWVDDMQSEIDIASGTMADMMLKLMYPLFIGPPSPEEHAAGIVRSLMYAAGYSPYWGVEDGDDCCGCC